MTWEYGEGFVPPTYAQLAPPTPATSLLNISDPRRGNMITPVLTTFGGNPDLQPETSDTLSAHEVRRLYRGMVETLTDAIKYRGVSSDANERTQNG